MVDREDSLRDDGRPWGYMADGEFRPLPKAPLLRAGLGPPPFDVELWDKSIRRVVHRPEPAPEPAPEPSDG
jgi:hypothetical protein